MSGLVVCWLVGVVLNATAFSSEWVLAKEQVIMKGLVVGFDEPDKELISNQLAHAGQAVVVRHKNALSTPEKVSNVIKKQYDFVIMPLSGNEAYGSVRLAHYVHLFGSTTRTILVSKTEIPHDILLKLFDSVMMTFDVIKFRRSFEDENPRIADSQTIEALVREILKAKCFNKHWTELVEEYVPAASHNKQFVEKKHESSPSWDDYMGNERDYNVNAFVGIDFEDMKAQNRQSLVINPLFDMRRSKKYECDIFILMPFDDDLAVVHKAIVDVASNLDLRAKRAEKFLTSEPIMYEIWQSILQSDIVIADCSRRNANVFYELGICHTVGKRVIMIAQDLRDIPFDITHRRVLKYELSSDGIESLRASLSYQIEDLLGLETEPEEPEAGVTYW